MFDFLNYLMNMGDFFKSPIFTLEKLYDKSKLSGNLLLFDPKNHPF